GGFDIATTGPRSTTVVFRQNIWNYAFLETRPSPRSLFAFAHDPARQTTWLLGGINEFNNSYSADVWGYRGGQFFSQSIKGAPETCDTPLAAYDTSRNRLVYTCWTTNSFDVEVYEYDGTEFKAIATTRNKPDVRRFSALVYDDNIKKVVLFGGYDVATQNFKDDTWTWDGANWTEVRNNKPPNRALHAMWYDPLQKRTILYGGIGRESIENHVDRFSDMWAFNGTGWTKLTIANTPGPRLGPQYAVDPATGKVLLFGGLKAEYTDPDEEETGTQFYDNETWQWDGGANSWTKLTPATSPRPRQNGRLGYDPITGRLTLFGGFAGFFYSDIWTWSGSNWEPVIDAGGGRRRAAGPTPAQPPTGGN
ncbi:MAG TPA: hypothetical protein VEU30_05545, partial [Thermoanaerobaculia bacterium]|nr:hypothetical protein [Thermoanaerobaculia bacterium]